MLFAHHNVALTLEALFNVFRRPLLEDQCVTVLASTFWFCGPTRILTVPIKLIQEPPEQRMPYQGGPVVRKVALFLK